MTDKFSSLVLPLLNRFIAKQSLKIQVNLQYLIALNLFYTNCDGISIQVTTNLYSTDWTGSCQYHSSLPTIKDFDNSLCVKIIQNLQHLCWNTIGPIEMKENLNKLFTVKRPDIE